MNITVSTQVTPTFTQIGPLCQNSLAPVLPNTSDNGFAGTWNPSTISTATVGTTTYTFTPTDPCATVTRMHIVVTGPTAIAITTTDATCGTANGTLTLGAVKDGVAPYTYSIDGGAFSATTNYGGLSGGLHTIDVKDASGCIFSTTALVIATTGPTAIATTTTDAACGTANGTLTLGAVTGGTAPYTYSIDGGAFNATTNYTGLAAGAHKIDVKDANGCIYSTTAGINNTNGPTAIATTTTDATCGTANGTLTLGAVKDGVTPYTYSIDGGAFTSTTNYGGL